MRLHRLSMTAIGPFVDETEIDFTRLGHQGLFLLEGPTGSGKSTVIDAITFALFGQVAQASADNERLRSHHAKPDVTPVVDLVFETQSGIFRVRRTPTYLRPKKAGTGLTRQNGTIKIWRLTSPDDPATGEPLSTSFREADDEIQRAIGLTREQFVQTMVLPQGEFATFLKSDTDNKRSLLQKLFGTDVVARTQAALVESRRAAMAERESAERAMDRALHGFLAAAGADEADAAALLAVPAKEAVEIGASWVDRLQSERRHAQMAARAAAAAVKKGRAAFEAAADLVSRHQRREVFRRREAALLEAAAEHADLRSELSAAEHAAVVQPSAIALEHAVLALDSAHVADRDTRAVLAPRWAAAEEPELDAAAAERLATVGALREIAAVEAGMATTREEIDSLVEVSSELAAEVSEWREEIAGIPAAIVQLTTQREQEVQLAAQVSAIRAERERAVARLEAAVRAVEIERAARHEEQVTVAALAALEHHELRLLQLRQHHREGLAAELGLALQLGEACQVCGSVEHPRPARPGANFVSKQQLDEAETQRLDLAAKVDAARTQLETQRLRLAELRTAADHYPPDVAEAKLADVDARLRRAERSEARVEALDIAVAQAQATASERTEQIQEADVRLAETSQQVKSLQSKLAADERAVRRHRGKHASVAERLATLTDEAKALAAARDAAASVRTARDNAVRQGETFRDLLTEHGFRDERQWRAALRTADTLADLRRRVRAVDDEVAAVSDALADPVLRDPALDEPLPDLDELQATLASAEEVLTAAEHDFASASDRFTAASAHLDRLRDTVAGAAQVLASTATAIRLGNLVSGNGDNRLKMELTTYVLVRRFTEVIAAANAQLRRVCDGRYELEHTENRSGNARAGLGLSVHDHFTGIARDPKTLSGGEAFYVALALALGLADVVRSESGGVDMGTLFIDEGFGSLDPATLDEVMSVLDSLRAGGRAVGIVSHVAELKTRIRDRIEVIPRPDRSSTLRVIA